VSAILHDAAVRSALRTRVQQVSPSADRKWGKMNPDQMFWHVNQGIAQALGQVEFQPMKKPVPIPSPALKFMLFNLPWIKGAPTIPEIRADEQRPDFAAEQARCLSLLDAFAAKSLDAAWVDHVILGRMSGRDWSRLHFKHLDHHLKQFNA
jgi:hypothetical protein